MPSYLYHNTTSNKTLSAVADEFENVDCSSGNINITFPDMAAIASGVRFIIVRTDLESNTLTLLPAASTSDTINGQSTFTMEPFQEREFVADTANTNWVMGTRAG